MSIVSTVVTPVLQNFGSVSLTVISVFVAHVVAEAAKLWKSGALKKEAEVLKQKGLAEVAEAAKKTEAIATASATAALKQFIADLQAGNGAGALDDALKSGLTTAEQEGEAALQALVAGADISPAPAYSPAETTLTPQSGVTVTGTVVTANVVAPAPVVVPAVAPVVDPAPAPAPVVVTANVVAPAAPVVADTTTATATISAPAPV